jgi:hypothetical protein
VGRIGDTASTGGPDGEDRSPPRTYMVQTYHLTITQQALQINWSLFRARRQREHGRDVPPPGSRLVRWSNRVTIICGRCHETMGHCVAFHADDLYGIVDDMPTTTSPRTRPPSLTTRSGRKAYWVHITGEGRKALATFHCRRCGHTHPPRNAHRLAHEIAQQQPKTKTIS